MPLTSICAYCGEKFKYRGNKKYCSRKCQQAQADERERQRKHSLWVDGVPRNTIGAGHELLACLDLMRKGYNVFRAISPSAPCDVILLDKDNLKTLRVEIRTCRVNDDGSISFSGGLKGNEKFDIYAAVLHDGRIEYFDNELNPYDIHILKTP